MGRYDRCTRCGRCVFGCPGGAKWDARQFLAQARDKGADVIERCTVEQVEIRGGVATGVRARVGRRRVFYDADLVMVAAGGFGTPALLERSGIPCEPRLFVDPVLCVAGVRKGVSYQNEISMPFIVQRDRYMLAPYLDYLSFYFDRRWRQPLDGILPLMVKLADTPSGTVRGNGVTVRLSAEDRGRFLEGLALCREILRRFGIAEEEMYPGTINAGHPGGTLPLTRKEAATLHHDRLPANVYVADATLLPESLGNPPILTIIALAKRIGRLCTGRV
jgi:choline dehydrogenase-like flavoprotein